MEILLQLVLIALALFLIYKQWLSITATNKFKGINPKNDEAITRHLPICDDDIAIIESAQDEMNYIGVRASTQKENRFLLRKLPIRDADTFGLLILLMSIFAGVLIILDELWGGILTNMVFCSISIVLFIKCCRPLASKRVDKYQGRFLGVSDLHRNINFIYIRFANHNSKGNEDKLTIPRSLMINLTEGQRYNFERCGNLVVSINGKSINNIDDPMFKLKDPRWYYLIPFLFSIFIVRYIFWTLDFAFWSFAEGVPLIIMFVLIIYSIRSYGEKSLPESFIELIR